MRLLRALLIVGCLFDGAVAKSSVRKFNHLKTHALPQGDNTTTTTSPSTTTSSWTTAEIPSTKEQLVPIGAEDDFEGSAVDLLEAAVPMDNFTVIESLDPWAELYDSNATDIAPTFVVNFEKRTFLCQHSETHADLHIHNMSSLCNGVVDCWTTGNLTDDETYQHCGINCPSSCNGSGACLFDGASRARCFCDAGWGGAACEEADLCGSGAARPCSIFARCTMSEGSASCSCNPGFQGDGKECYDMDECARGNLTCPEHAACINVPGSAFCECIEGHEQHGSPLKKCVASKEFNFEGAITGTGGALRCATGGKCPPHMECTYGFCRATQARRNEEPTTPSLPLVDAAKPTTDRKLIRQCFCSEIEECKMRAASNLTSCFDSCDDDLKVFGNATSSYLDCFEKGSDGIVSAEECLEDTLGAYCVHGNETTYLVPSNNYFHLKEYVGTKFIANKQPESKFPLRRKAHAAAVGFQQFYHCAKHCVHSRMLTCMREKKCMIRLPSLPAFSEAMTTCAKANGKSARTLRSTCLCLLHKKGLRQLAGSCGVITPNFVKKI